MSGLGLGKGFVQEGLREQVAAGKWEVFQSRRKRTERLRMGVEKLRNWALPVGKGLGRQAMTVLTPSQGDVRFGCCPQCPQKG